MMAGEEGILDLSPDALRYCDELYDKWRELADDVKAESGESEFTLGQSLRLTWVPAQRADKALMPMFAAKSMENGYRIASDGLLERQVQLPPPANATWVPVVPDGMAMGNLTWKRWLFLQCHVSVLGAHRNGKKTCQLLARQVWWQTMKDDVQHWWENCLACIRFRKMPQKTPSVPVVPTNRDCWEEVMVDLEGPSNPADKNGCKYTMTYICCLCQGLLLESSPRITAAEVRSMFANCVMRSGTIPTLIRTDRGPELKNVFMSEYSSMLGMGHPFGTPWRPMEQGLVEFRHLETQKVMGMFAKDIMQCFPNETGELLHVVEFIVYNTPGPHGYTLRDIDRRWSMATPLDKELQLFVVNQFEPITDYLKSLFKNYREIRVRVLGWLKDASAKRADLANRFRRFKNIQPGDEVVVRDPRQRKAGGRAPYRQPYTDPVVVLDIHGNKCSLRTRDGTKLYEIHLEDVMLVPETARSLEKPDLHIELTPEEELTLDALERRSPGMMMEDQGRKVEAQAKMFEEARKKISPGKLDKVQTGNFIAYVVAGKVKDCTTGKVTALSRAKASVVVHR